MEQSTVKTKETYFILFILMCLAFMIFLGGSDKLTKFKAPADTSDKFLLLLIDNISINDLQKTELKNFKKIINMSSFGLMNTRVNSVASTDPLAIYASIGAGKRIIENDNDAFRNDIGKIGSLALANHLTTAFIGNADTNVQSVSSRYIIMDKNGIVPINESGQDLLMEDPTNPWGHRTNPVKLLEKTTLALEKAELVCVDFGDTHRITQAKGSLNQTEYEKARLQAIKNADLFLSSLLNKLDMSNTTIMIISPNASTGVSSWNSNYLTPVIFYKPGINEGLLYSETTKRAGLVSFLDIAPTILRELGIKISDASFQGNIFHSVEFPNTFKKLQDELRGFLEIKRARYIVHGFYVLSLIFSLIVLYYPLIRGLMPANQRIVRGAVVASVSIPFFSIIFPAFINFGHHYTMAAFIIGAVIITGFIFSYSSKLTEKAFFIFCLSIWSFLIVDLLGHQSNLLKTPLGFADVFTGGRYYGINNDCMGILIGSAFYWIFYISSKSKSKKMIQYGLVTGIGLLTALSLMPFFGANVGGTIAALSTTILALLCLKSKNLTKRTLVSTIALVFIIELFIAYLDNGPGTQTHAGKALRVLTDLNNATLLTEIIKSKLRLFVLMLIIPPWNLLLLGQFLIYYLYIKKEKMEIPGSYDVLAYSALITLIFNDTGIIASAIIFTHIMLPLGMQLNENRMNLYEYGKTLTQRI